MIPTIRRIGSFTTDLSERRWIRLRRAELSRSSHPAARWISRTPQQIVHLKQPISQMETDRHSADQHRDKTNGRIKDFALIRPTGTAIRKHEDINAFLLSQIAKRLEKPFDEMPAFRIGDFTVAVQTRPGHMDEAVLTVKGARDSVYYIQVGSDQHSDNWQRIVNFLDSGIAKEQERMTQSQEKYKQLEAELFGLSDGSRRTLRNI